MTERRSRSRVTMDVDVYAAAIRRTEHIMDTFDRVVVMFSGGKDSTAVLNVALQVAHSHPRFARHLPMRCVHWDEEAIPYETEDYVRRVAERDDIQLEWYCVPLKHRNACARRSPWWWPWAPEAEHLWCRPLPPEAITTLAGFPNNPVEARLSAPDAAGLLADPAHGNVAQLMGIRAQESLIRYRAVTMKVTDNYIMKSDLGTSHGNLYKAYPIYDWKTEDVWTAPALNGWDYNRAYDRLEMAGVSASLQRCSPAFGEEPLEKLYTYASCFPDVWDKMVDRVPGVGAAVRYARTELYAYRDRPAKPAGMTWPDFLLQYLAKYEPKDATFIGERLQEEMRLHYRKTTQPIAPAAKHPQTGVSWNYLLMLAMRGDYKGRKSPGADTDRDEFGRPPIDRWRRYVTDITTVVGEGRVHELASPYPIPADPADLLPDYARVVPA